MFVCCYSIMTYCSYVPSTLVIFRAKFGQAISLVWLPDRASKKNKIVAACHQLPAGFRLITRNIKQYPEYGKGYPRNLKGTLQLSMDSVRLRLPRCPKPWQNMFWVQIFGNGRIYMYNKWQLNQSVKNWGSGRKRR